MAGDATPRRGGVSPTPFNMDSSTMKLRHGSGYPVKGQSNSGERFLSQAVSQSLKKRAVQLLGVLVFLLASLLVLILAHYDPNLPSLNTAGVLGANLEIVTQEAFAFQNTLMSILQGHSTLVADFLLQCFGMATFLLIAVLVVWSGLLLSQQSVRHFWRRLFALLGTLICFATCLAYFKNSGAFLVTPTLGGAVGQIVLSLTHKMIGASSLRAIGLCYAVLFAITLFYTLGIRGYQWKAIFKKLFFASNGGKKVAQKGAQEHARGRGEQFSEQNWMRRKLSSILQCSPALPPFLSTLKTSLLENKWIKQLKGADRIERNPYTSSFGDNSNLQDSLLSDESSVDASFSLIAKREDRLVAETTTATAKTIQVKSKIYDDDGEDEDYYESQGSASGKRHYSAPTFAEEYELPSVDLLDVVNPNKAKHVVHSPEVLQEHARQLEQVLQEFGVRGEIVGICPGPVVTLYELKPAAGIKTSRVIGLADDIARSMSAHAARIAVISGRNVIGIELPNPTRETVYLRELLVSDEYRQHPAPLAMILGKDIGGNPIVVDLARMPHLLVAGTTGSGKSVSINTMILSILYRMSPDKCKFIMVDPKMLEFSAYDGIPHLLTPVVTDAKKAVVALKWAVREMENRYRSMSKLSVRNIDGYNARLEEVMASGEILMRRVQTGFDPDTGKPIFENQALDVTPLPYIVIVVDEMADLMLVAGKEIEATVQRLAQMARAAGIHLIMATQRPSVDVITGTIKANFPTRISFMVTSKIDSRTILGEQGAEQLLGQGDMLYMMGGGRLTRVHGPFVKDNEVERIVNYLKSQAEPNYIESITEDDSEMSLGEGEGAKDADPLYRQAVDIVRREGKASTSFVQRHLQIGYNRAARMIEQMEKENIITPANSVGKREVIG